MAKKPQLRALAQSKQELIDTLADRRALAEALICQAIDLIGRDAVLDEISQMIDTLPSRP